MDKRKASRVFKKDLVFTKFISVAVVLCMVLTLLPADILGVLAAKANGGFELSLNWNNDDEFNSEDKLTYIYDSKEKEIRTIRLNVRYANKDMGMDTYQPGEVSITVPGIGDAYRGKVIGASSVAADKAGAAASEYAWSYTYNSSTDTYTFTNNNFLSQESHFAGAFEILWSFDSRETVDKYKKELKATLRAPGGISLDSNQVKYEQKRLKDEYSLSLRTEGRMYSAEGYNTGVNETDYWWVKYEATSMQQLRSLGVHESTFELLIPADAKLRGADGASYTQKGTEVIGGITYNIWEVRRAAHSDTSVALPFVVSYPRNKFNEAEDIYVYARTMGTYNEHNDRELLAEDDCVIQVQDYEFPEYTGEILSAQKKALGIDKWTEFAKDHCNDCYWDGYIDARHMLNGGGTYNFELSGQVKYPKLKSNDYGFTYYDLELVDERVEVQMQKGGFRRLEEGEYSFVSVKIPAVKDVANMNGTPVKEGYPIDIYVKDSLDGTYTKHDGVKLADREQTVQLPANTVGIKLALCQMNESVDITYTANIRFHTNDDGIELVSGIMKNELDTYLFAYDSIAPQGDVPAGAEPYAADSGQAKGDPTEGHEAVDEQEVTEEQKETEEGQKEEQESEKETTEGSVKSKATDVVQAPGGLAGDYTNENRYDFGAPYITGDVLHVLERPNYYFNNTTLNEFEQPKDGYIPTTVDIDTWFDYLDGESLGVFDVYTILPAGMTLPETVKSADDLYTELKIPYNLGISEAAAKKALTLTITEDYKGSGRTFLQFHFDFGANRIVKPSSTMRLKIPIVVSGENYYKYGASYTVRSVSIVRDDDTVARPSRGVAVDNGAYANVDEIQYWKDLNGDGDIEELLSHSISSQQQIEHAVAIEEGITKFIEAESTNHKYIIPKKENEQKYIEDELPLLEKGQEYSYRLRMNPNNEPGATHAENIIIMDVLEKAPLSKWQGILKGVDISEANKLLTEENGREIKGTIYYSTKDYSAEITAAESGDGKYKPNLASSDWSTTFTADAKTIAVSFDGARLTGQQYLSIVVHMIAPEIEKQDARMYEITENKTGVYYDEVITTSNIRTSIWLPSNPVAAKIMPQLVNLEIEKVDSADNEPLAGVTFDIYEQVGQAPDPQTDPKVREGLKTNEKGRITITNVEESIYYAVETSAPKGYEASNANYKLEKIEEGLYGIKVENIRKKGEIELKKVSDRDEHVLLPEAKFNLYRSDGTTVLTDLKTDANGKLTIPDLEWGDYYLEETEAPDGYEIVENNRYEFSINAANNAGEELGIIMIENVQKPASVRLTKSDAQDNTMFLEGASYRLFTEDDIFIGTYITDPNGQIYVGDLTFGKYYFHELVAPQGYDKNPDKIPFELTAAHVDTTLELSTTDKRLEGKARMYKTDERNRRVAGAEYGLYKADGTPVKTDTTDGIGEIVFENLEWGDYYVQEITAPDGYELNDEKYYFTVDKDNVNEEIPVYVTDEHIKGKVLVIKKDADDTTRLLEGAVFNLYELDGTLIAENLKTNSDGELLIEDITWGSYYLQETKAPNGYAMTDEKIRFSINSTTIQVVQELEVLNAKQGKDLTLTKRIYTDEIVLAHGTPTFTFKVTGDDIHGTIHTWYKTITFDKEYIKKNSDKQYLELSVTFANLPAGTYTASEEPVIRYELEKIIDIENGEESGETVEFDLENNDSGKATFVNRKEDQGGTSETVQVTNLVKEYRKLTALIVKYRGPDTVETETVDRNLLDVWAVYDDGTQKKLGNDEYTLNPNKFTAANNGEPVTVGVSYTERGITRKGSFNVNVFLEQPFKWTINGDGISATITAYTGTDTTVVFPEKVYGNWNGNTLQNVDQEYVVTSITGDESRADDERAVFTSTQKAKITGIVLPDTLKKIDGYAFDRCQKIVGPLRIPEGVTEIGKYAFDRCSGMTEELKLPNSLVTIGERAFFQCTGLGGKLSLPDTVITIGKSAFYGCEGFTGLKLSKGLTEIVESVFYGCSGMQGVLDIHEGITSIGEYAFQRCSGFSSLKLPNTLTNIKGRSTFQQCSGFTGELRIPNSVTEIGTYWTFGACSGFTSLVIGEGVKVIPDYAFVNCSGLKKIKIGSNVEEIGYGATFNGLINVEETVVIPQSVITMEYQPYYGTFNNLGANNNYSPILKLPSRFSSNYGLDPTRIERY